MNNEQKHQAILDILRDVPEYEQGHHLLKPFLSAYQIAIKFAERFPNDPDVRRLSVGGSGIGENNSLAKSLAKFLSQLIKKGCTQIEGGFISHENLEQMTFSPDINVSTLNSKQGHSIFRYVGE